METYNLATTTKALYDSPFSLFTVKTLRDLWSPTMRPAAFFSLVRRLEERSVLQRLERNKYALAGRVVHDFLVANFLYEPSYVSLETALNVHGILPQFPYGITSVTPKKSMTKTANNKTFRYVHLKNTLFWGYEMSDGALVAQPEKALLDLLYLQQKGLAVVHLDDYDMDRVDKTRFHEYAKRFSLSKKIDIL